VAELGPLALVATLAAAYASGVARAWQRAGTGRLVHVREAVWFALGLVVTLAALVGPIDARAGTSLTAHMVQHVLLLSIAAPMLAIGEPVVALLYAFDDRTRARLAPWWRRAVRSQRGRGWVVWIGITLAAQTAVLFAWHMPPLYDAAIRHPLLHGFEHLSFLLAAVAFWWVVAGTGWPSRRGAAVFAVFASWFPPMGLGALMTMAKSPWYPVYMVHSSAGALGDQQMAGVVMWAVGGLASVIAAAVLFGTWLAEIDRRHPPGEPLVVPPVEAMG
jgi:cytochrome c oxidase assembly factor CtaG